MKKPPFQFGLKAVLLAMTGAAVLAWFAVPGPQQIEAVAVLAVLAAVAFAAILAAAVLIAFGFSLAMLLYHAIRLCGWRRYRARAPRASSRHNGRGRPGLQDFGRGRPVLQRPFGL